MSLLTSFVLSHLVPSLEKAFIAHEPEMQAALVAEVQAFATKLGEWIDSKMPTKSDELLTK